MRTPVAKGFTLIELVVVLAVAAVLTVVALPSFESALRANRVSGRVNDFIASVGLARTEAIRSNVGAGICASVDGSTCGGNWSDGWIVWNDLNNNNAPDALTGEILRVIGPQDRVFFQANVAAENQIDFDSRGRREGALAAGTLQLRPVTCATGQPFLRTLTLTTTGSLRVAKGNCT